MWRDLYRAAINPEAFFEADRLRALMSEVRGSPEASAGSEPLAELTNCADQATAEFTALLGHESVDTANVLRSMLVQSTPMASVLGAPLQGLSAPGVFEDPVQLTAMALLAEDVGAGTARTARYDEYRRLLLGQGLTEAAVPAHELDTVLEVRDELFALPAVLLALTRRSDAFTFELLGVDHVMRSVGLLPVWQAARGQQPSAANWDRLDAGLPSGAGVVAEPAKLSAQLAQACGELPAELARQFGDGIRWFAAALKRWGAEVLAASRSAADPAQAMCALVQARAREASAYHQSFLLAGRPLADWLREAQQDPRPLVRELAGSRLIKPGQADRSSLVNGLIDVRGPMFRIFSPQDVRVIRRWINALPELAQTAIHAPSSGYAPPSAASALDGTAGCYPEDLREAYFALQGRALAPRTRAYALEYVHAWLAEAAKAVGASDRSLPPAWTNAGLRPWLLDQHERHDHEFHDSDAAALPDRAAIIDSTVQLAPLTLIDGSWLQGFTDLQLASSRIGAPLFQTYWDELGNGELALNHPKIYRDVLRQMDIELAPTGSREFAYDERIRVESLRLPVYWLSLGKFPVTFLPEILGLNLAMELSGVGGGYRSARRFLKHYGFNTRFVDIHNTIDNVSTGHSAWAADAIDVYLRERVDLTDPGEHAAVWNRVRVGYESLTPVDTKATTAKRASFLAGRLRRGAAVATPPPADALLHHSPIRITL